MGENQNMNIKSKVVHYLPFSRHPRERSACPKCESIHVKKRVRTRDYICVTCGWEGGSVKKVIW